MSLMVDYIVVMQILLKRYLVVQSASHWSHPHTVLVAKLPLSTEITVLFLIPTLASP